MQHHEKRSFWKFFLAYFSSVAILILVAGHLFCDQEYQQRVKDEHFAMISYARQIKMHEPTTATDITHTIVEKNIPNFTMGTLVMSETQFEKYVPVNKEHTHYLFITKSRKHFDAHIYELRLQIIAVQMMLLILFALISLYLTRNALRPMREAIKNLDKFAKDLIHDLNTPLTTIKLNLKLLEKDSACSEKKALKRIEKSSYEISELHENLKVLLEEDTFQLEDVDICKVVHEMVLTYKSIYPDLNFATTCSALTVHINPNAFKQILHNLLSNACKYNSTKGKIAIYVKEKTLIIEDNGSGIENPERVFERNYSEQSSSGIGLDIVKRLCDAMDIEIMVQADASGTRFSLKF